jgi:hypothetical protein
MAGKLIDLSFPSLAAARQQTGAARNSSPEHFTGGEISLEASYLIPRLFVGIFNAVALPRVTTGQEVVFKGWTSGFGLNEVPTGSRFVEAGLTVVPLFKLEGAVAESTTTLYRAVSKGELFDVAENGFRLGPNSMGNKWFAESAADASAWGKWFYKADKQPFFTMEVTVPNSIVNKMMRNPRLDGIGPARSADENLLDALNKACDIHVLDGNFLPR